MVEGNGMYDREGCWGRCDSECGGGGMVLKACLTMFFLFCYKCAVSSCTRVLTQAQVCNATKYPLKIKGLQNRHQEQYRCQATLCAGFHFFFNAVI